MTTKPKSVLAWAAYGSDGMLYWRSIDDVRQHAKWYEAFGKIKVQRVRITVVRERKKAKATKRRAKR